MEILKINQENEKEVNEAIKASIGVIERGGLIVHPTDSCYGIGADMNNEDAIKKIYQFKNRDYSKPFFITVKNVEEFNTYGKASFLVERILQKKQEKIFTFIVPRKDNVPISLNPGLKTIGIQIPRNIFYLKLLSKLNNPLVGTSANLSGREVCYSVEELLNQFGEENNFPSDILILDVGELPKKRPSTVVEIIDEENFRVLRK